METEYTKADWAEVVPFGWGLLKDGDLYENYRRLLSEARDRFGLKGKKVGVEGSFEVIAPTYRMAEPVVPSGPWRGLLDTVFAEATLVDVTDFLQKARSIKTTYELSKMRIANEIAEMGLLDALSKLAVGHDRSAGGGHGGIQDPGRRSRAQGSPVGALGGRGGRRTSWELSRERCWCLPPATACRKAIWS